MSEHQKFNPDWPVITDYDRNREIGKATLVFIRQFQNLRLVKDLRDYSKGRCGQTLTEEEYVELLQAAEADKVAGTHPSYSILVCNAHDDREKSST